MVSHAACVSKCRSPFGFCVGQKIKYHSKLHDETKSQQHPKGFPGGPPPQYWPGLSPLNFRVQMGSGVFDEVWPLAKANETSPLTCRYQDSSTTVKPLVVGIGDVFSWNHICARTTIKPNDCSGFANSWRVPEHYKTLGGWTFCQFTVEITIVPKRYKTLGGWTFGQIMQGPRTL